MRRLTYPLLYCLVLLGFFISLSVSFYGTPSQRAQRLGQSIEDALGVPVVIDEASPDGHVVTARQVRIPALQPALIPTGDPPPPLARFATVDWWIEHPTSFAPSWIARLIGARERLPVDVNGRTDEHDESLSPEKQRPMASSTPFFRFRAPTVELDLVRRTPLEQNSTTTPRMTWNLGDLATQIASRFDRDWNLHGTIGTVNVRFHTENASEREKDTRSLAIEKFELARQSGRNELALRGRVRLGESGEGRFEALLDTIPPGDRLRPGLVRANLRDVAALESWSPFLPRSLERFESTFQPRGKVALEMLFRASSDKSMPPAAAIGGSVRHRGSRFRIPRLNLDLTDVSGPVEFDGEVASFGLERHRMRTPLHARLQKTDVSLSGSCGGQHTTLSILLPRSTIPEVVTALTRVFSGLPNGGAGVAALLGNAVDSLGARGRAAGEIVLLWSEGDNTPLTWRLSAFLEQDQPGVLPLVETLKVTIEGSSADHGGRWTCDVSGTRLRGLGELHGKVRVSWNEAQETCLLESHGLQVGSRGRIQGSLRLSLGTGQPVAGELVANDVEVVSDALEATLVHTRITFDGTDAQVIMEFGECKFDLTRAFGSEAVTVTSTGRVGSALLSMAKVRGTLTQHGLEVRDIRPPGQPGLQSKIELDWQGRLAGRIGPLAPVDDTRPNEPLFLELSGTLDTPRADAVPAVPEDLEGVDVAPAVTPSSP